MLLKWDIGSERWCEKNLFKKKTQGAVSHNRKIDFVIPQKLVYCPQNFLPGQPAVMG